MNCSASLSKACRWKLGETFGIKKEFFKKRMHHEEVHEDNWAEKKSKWAYFFKYGRLKFSFCFCMIKQTDAKNDWFWNEILFTSRFYKMEGFLKMKEILEREMWNFFLILTIVYDFMFNSRLKLVNLSI